MEEVLLGLVRDEGRGFAHDILGVSQSQVSPC
jgi:hypothetical protein